uniref:Uncharacterized protein n=1 Tax=Glossina brevipalpis TaxID=37001 RepID=A0A1A9W513_9MUSC
MKFAILLCVLSVLLMHQTAASPIKLSERQERALARQQSAGVAPAVQAVGEDDDDDDDEDDDDYGPDLGELVEDDDDDDDDDDEEDDDDDDEDDRPQGQAAPASATSDDDDEEDDDDDDYLDRLFDDILGEEDDDDDDDDDVVSPVANVQRPAVVPAAAVEDLSSAPQIASAVLSDGVDLPAESGNAVEIVATDNSIDPNVAPLTSTNNEGEQYVFYHHDTINHIVDEAGSGSSSHSGNSGNDINSMTNISSSSASNNEQIHLNTQLQQVQQQLIAESNNNQNKNHNQLLKIPSIITKTTRTTATKSTSSSNYGANGTKLKTNKINLNHGPYYGQKSPTIGLATGTNNNLGAAVANTIVKGTGNNKDNDNYDDDDDDDDDDIDDGVDEITGALTGDDDDADDADDDDDDEDDDDDDIIGDDVIEARRAARSLENNNIIDMTAGAFQERNNHFVDAIFSRINQIVANSYDPFIVQLSGRTATKTNIQRIQSHSNSNNKSKTKGNKPSATKTPIKKLKNTKSEPRTHTASKEAVADSNTIGNSEQNLSSVSQEYEKNIELKTQTELEKKRRQLEKSQNHHQQQQFKQHKYIVENKQIDGYAHVPNSEKKTETQTEDNDNKQPEKRTVVVNEAAVKSGHESRKTSTKSHKQNATKKGHNAGGGNITTANTNNNNVKKKQKTASTNTINSNSKIDKANKDGEVQKAQGSLTGLASLKRVGNVKVVTDPEGRNSTIKARFTLGPLILRVEKSFKRAGVENVKSATARTNEMIGRIKFGVVNDRAALISIKVQQPKQIEVESKDNHDRTREFVWRRTPKIARLVNEKLKMAADMLFAPQAVSAVRL